MKVPPYAVDRPRRMPRRLGAICSLVAALAVVGPVLAVDGPEQITTVAGTGAQGYSGDGGPADQAQLRQPTGIAVDAAGNRYIADFANHRVRRVNPAGTITTVAGTGVPGLNGDGGPADQAQLWYPSDVAADAAGNLYIADYANHLVRRVSAAGTITTVAGTGIQGFSGDGGPADQARLFYPTGVAVDGSGNLYIADFQNHRVRRVSAAGTITTVAGTGTLGFSGDGGPADQAQLNYPRVVAVDAAGNLFLADSGNFRVRQVSVGGTITTVAGTGTSGFSGDGAPATQAQISVPTGVAVDAQGSLYIADNSNQRVRKVSAGGTITTVVGTGAQGSGGDGGSANQAQLNSPLGLAVDTTGFLYVADNSNHRVRVVGGAVPTPVITVPANLTVQAMDPSGAVVTFPPPTTSNGGDGPTCVSAPVAGLASGSTFPVGVTTITCSSTNGAGTTTASFTVTVVQSPVACQSQDGKISGRGSTFATALWYTLMSAYRDDVCGLVPDATGASLKNGVTLDPAGTAYPNVPRGMVAYNYAGAETGSGEGRTAMQCRTDAFAGSDAPYSTSQYSALNGAPLGSAGCPPAVGSTLSPYLEGPFPNAADATAPIMSFPLGGASVVVAVNLTGAACPGGAPPVELSFTKDMVEGIFDGRILLWSDPALRAGGLNADLALCTTPILRRVRADDSGTTQIVKNYLAKVDPAGPGCDAVAGNDWTSLRNAVAPNNGWPNLASVASHTPASAAATGSCSAIESAEGNAGVAAAVNTIPGAVGYIDLADATTLAPLAIQASLQNATETSFVEPSNGPAANCNFNAIAAPIGQTGVVGLNPGDNWSVNNSSNAGSPPNRSDVTLTGSGYPMCGLTYALVYTGLSRLTGGTAITGLTNNQRRTLYSFLSYSLRNVAQDKLSSASNQRLSQGLANTIRRGFQANF